MAQLGLGRGGGGGGRGSNAEDLADIFELQQDRLRNQYEAVQRGETAQQRQQQDSTASTLDETVEKLRQLAARQRQQDQRAQRKADSLSRMGQSGASGGDAQRQLANEAEQTARQLERLARERQSQSLADAARIANVDALEVLIRARLASMTPDEARAGLAAGRIANARVNDLSGVWSHEQLRARDRFVDVQTPSSTVELLKSPFDISGWTPADGPVPALGEHDAALLASHGAGRMRE